MFENPHLTSEQVVDQDIVAVSADTSQTPRGEREDENDEQLDDAIPTMESVAGDETHREPASGHIVNTQPDDCLVVLNTVDVTHDVPTKTPSTATKPSVSVKLPPGKPTGGLATPTVKKART